MTIEPFDVFRVIKFDLEALIVFVDIIVNNKIVNNLMFNLKKLLLKLSSYCENLGTTKPKTYLKKGNTSDELIKLINTEKRITVLVLGASIETGNPGPLINFVMNASFESRIPITIVPGNLTDEQIDDLI